MKLNEMLPRRLSTKRLGTGALRSQSSRSEQIKDLYQKHVIDGGMTTDEFIRSIRNTFGLSHTAARVFAYNASRSHNIKDWERITSPSTGDKWTPTGGGQWEKLSPDQRRENE